MHEQTLAKAAAPAPTVVLGLLLKPYSLGHDVRLTGLGNPLSDSDKATPRQLSAAVMICSQTWRECERMPWDPLIRLKLWLWRRRARGLDFKTELARFIRYRNEGSLEFPGSGVSRNNSSGDCRVAGTPLVLRIQQFLMLHFNLKEHEAWDYPAGLAKCRCGCYWEENGDWQVYSEVEHSLDQYKAQEDAKLEAILRDNEAKGAARL